MVAGFERTLDEIVSTKRGEELKSSYLVVYALIEKNAE